MEPTRPLILGHRGAAGRLRENTMAAFDAAWRLGADGVELDVRQAVDGLVIHHDARLRLGRRAHGLRSVAVHALPSWLPRLSDVVAWARSRRVLLDVELKEPGTEADVLRECKSILEKCVFTSFRPDVAHALRVLQPKARVGWISKSEPSAIAMVVGELRPSFVVLPARRCTAHLVGDLRAMSADVWAWNVNDAYTAQRMANLGVSCLITDDPKRLVAWRDGRGPLRKAPHTGRPGS